jgi:hypothetical protein
MAAALAAAAAAALASCASARVGAAAKPATAMAATRTCKAWKVMWESINKKGLVNRAALCRMVAQLPMVETRQNRCARSGIGTAACFILGLIPLMFVQWLH